MATPASGVSLEAIVRVSQIILGALIVGPLALIAASLFISPLISPPADPPLPGRPTNASEKAIVCEVPSVQSATP